MIAEELHAFFTDCLEVVRWSSYNLFLLARAGSAAKHPPTRTRSFVDGRERRSVRRFLYLLVRWVDEEESHPGGSVELEYLRKTAGREPGATAGPTGERRGGGWAANGLHAKNWRLLRRLHGRGGH